MSQSRKSGKRAVKPKNFETDPETRVVRHIREQNRDTRWLFYYEKAVISTSLDGPIWPIGVTEDDKLSLKHGEWVSIIHRNGIRRAIYLGKGPSKQIGEHKAITANRLNRGEQPVFFVDVVSEISTPVSSRNQARASENESENTAQSQSRSGISSQTVYLGNSAIGGTGISENPPVLSREPQGTSWHQPALLQSSADEVGVDDEFDEVNNFPAEIAVNVIGYPWFTMSNEVYWFVFFAG